MNGNMGQTSKHGLLGIKSKLAGTTIASVCILGIGPSGCPACNSCHGSGPPLPLMMTIIGKLSNTIHLGQETQQLELYVRVIFQLT